MTLPTSPPAEASLEAVWDRLNTAFSVIYAEVLRDTATVEWLAEAHSNSSFPLMAYARFERKGCPTGDALVISVDINRRSGILTWTTDAGQDSGAVLAEGPKRSAPDTEPLSSWIGEAADEAIAWFHAETPNFIAYLNQEPTPYGID